MEPRKKRFKHTTEYDDDDRTKEWKTKHDKYHRGRDKPSVIHVDGLREWYVHGSLHREGDKPARIHSDGKQEWYLYDTLDREGDKPAIIHADGSQEWYENSVLHREGDKPARIWSNGFQEWWDHDEFIDGEWITDFGSDGPRYEWVKFITQAGLETPSSPLFGILGAFLQDITPCPSDDYRIVDECVLDVALFL